MVYDAIVIGARCAGSPTAMLLARKGYRVLLVDRSTFPSDIISTHFIHNSGIAHLKCWGLLDKVAASNCPPITQAIFDVGEFALRGSAPPTDGVAEAYGPRRKILDKILLDAAIEAGVEVREAFTVEEILMEAECVSGIRGRAKNGSTVTEKSAIVIGADGMHSRLARTVQASEYSARPPLACYYYAYWSGVSMGAVEFCPRNGRIVIVIPTNDDFACVIAGWTSKEFHEYRANIEHNYLKTLQLVPNLADRVRSGKREERFVGTADLPNFFRKPYGPGWALVGDSGYHKDPITAQGISDAFRDAELLASAIDEGFSQRRPLDEALASYERKRNEKAMPLYEFTCQLATLSPPAPETAQLYLALRTNQAETNRFLGTFNGTVSIPEFFSADNMRRIISGAGRDVP